MVDVGLVQFAPLIGKPEANAKKTTELMASSACDLYVLPELANSGYRFKNRAEAMACSEELNGSIFITALKELAAQKQCYVVSGFCEKEGDKLYNSSVLIGPNGVIGVYRKLHLFMDEKDIFELGNLGLPVFDTPIGKIGMQVCFDWMFPEAWRALAIKGAQIIAHPSNLVLPYCQGVMPSYALVNKVYIVTANRIGAERDLKFTGQSVIASPKGEVIAKASEDHEELLKAKLDLSEANNKHITARNHIWDDRRIDVYGNLKPNE